MMFKTLNSLQNQVSSTSRKCGKITLDLFSGQQFRKAINSKQYLQLIINQSLPLVGLDVL